MKLCRASKWLASLTTLFLLASPAQSASVVSLGLPLPLTQPARCADGWLDLETVARAIGYIEAQPWWQSTGLRLRVEVLPGDDAYSTWLSTTQFAHGAPPACVDASSTSGGWQCEVVRLGLLGPAATDAATLAKLVSREQRIPLLSYAVSLDALTPSPYDVVPDNFTQAVSPLFRSSATDEQIAVALVSYLQHLFGHVVLMHPKTFSGNGAAAAFQDAARAYPHFWVWATYNYVRDSDESIHSALEAIREGEPRVIVLLGSPSDAARVLYTASHLGMTGKGWTWVGTGKWIREVTWASAGELLTPDAAEGSDIPEQAAALRRQLSGASSSAAVSDVVRRAMAGVMGVAPAPVLDNAALPSSLGAFVLTGGRLRAATMTNYSQGTVLLGPPLVPSTTFPVLEQPTAYSCAALFSERAKSAGLPFDGVSPQLFHAVWAMANAVADSLSAARALNASVSAPTSSQVISALAGGISRPSPLTGLPLSNFRNGDREGVPLSLINIPDEAGVPVEIARWTATAKRGAAQPHMIEGDGSVGAGYWSDNVRSIVWSSGATDVPPDRRLEVSHAEAIAGAIALVGVVLSLLVGAVLHHNEVTVLPESGATVLIGGLMGGIIRFGLGSEVSAATGFSESTFYLVMLPIIIFQSGYQLPLGSFFKNLGSISMYAIAGTIISTGVIQGVIYSAGRNGLILQLTWEEALAFASLLSATDPVATLAMFGALKVHPTLNALVYGESVINDAVAIALYRTSTAFLINDVTYLAAASAVGSFVVILFGSVLVGAVIGLLCSVAFRYVNVTGQSREVRWQKQLRAQVTQLKKRTTSVLSKVTSPVRLRQRRPGSAAAAAAAAAAGASSSAAGTPSVEMPPVVNTDVTASQAASAPPSPMVQQQAQPAATAAAASSGGHTAGGGGGGSDELVDLESGAAETAVILVFSYIAFLAAEAIALSGIVSSLVAGIAMNLYVQPVLTRDGRLTSLAVLRMLSSLADCAVFFTIGLNVVLTLGIGSYDWGFIFLTLVGCLLGRALNVFPLTAILNIGRSDKISARFQIQMWHAGLRGAIAYASALSFPSQHREAIVNCTSAIVLITLYSMGGTTVNVLKKLEIPYNIEEVDERDGLLGGGRDNSSSHQSPVKLAMRWLDGAIRRVVYGKTFLQEMEQINERALESSREKVLQQLRSSGSALRLTTMATAAEGAVAPSSGSRQRDSIVGMIAADGGAASPVVVRLADAADSSGLGSEADSVVRNLSASSPAWDDAPVTSAAASTSRDVSATQRSWHTQAADADAGHARPGAAV